MPSLGEHTVSVLEEAGVDQAVIDKVLKVSTAANYSFPMAVLAGLAAFSHRMALWRRPTARARRRAGRGCESRNDRVSIKRCRLYVSAAQTQLSRSG